MKIKELINSTDYGDLLKLNEDLKSGGRYIKKLVDSRIKELMIEPKSICAVCGKSIKVGDDAITLVFGRDDFKKKATFCAHDCLEYFLSNMKEHEKKNKLLSS